MKNTILKKITIFFIIILFLTNFFIVNIIGEDKNDLHNRKMNYKNNLDTLTMSINIESFDIEKKEIGHNIYVTNFGRLLIPGKPNLPSKIFSIAIPPGAKITGINYTTDEITMLPGIYEITPSPLPRVIGEENPLIYEQEKQKYDENYNDTYNNNEFYPSSIVEFIRTAGYRKYNLIDVRVTPFQYQPLSGKIVYYSNIELSINYTISSDFSTENIMVDSKLRCEETAKKIIFNYDQAKDWYPIGTTDRGDSFDFVIITLDSLITAVNSLKNWEIAKGRSVEVVTTSWIDSNYDGYDLAEKIRNFLRDKYPTNEWGIEDVLIVGHYDDIPMRRTAQDVGYGQPETDFYYAELSLPDSQSWDEDGDHQYGENSDSIDFLF